MDELLAKYMLGEATTAEVETIDQWILVSEENRKYFTQFKLIWETSKTLKIESKLDPDESWNEFKQLTQHRGQEAEIVSIQRSGFGWVRIAAILLVMLTIGALLFNWLKPEKQVMLTVQTTDQSRVDTLSDGSVITLNNNSIISYPKKFAGNIRQVKLIQGEAFFNVVHNESKPFIISVNNIKVQDIGTSFNVKSKNAATEVIVESGMVQVSREKLIIKLAPEDKLNIDSGTGRYKKETVSDRLYKYYRTHEFVANKTPLWRVVQVLNEAYGVNIVVPDKKHNSLLLSTTLKYGQLENNLNVICQTFNLHVRRSQHKIIIE